MTDGYKINRVLIRQNGEYSDMKGPCPDGFHVPTKSEWEGLKTIMDGLGLSYVNSARMGIYLHMPMAGNRSKDSSIGYQDVNGNYWSSSPRGDSYTSSSFSFYFATNSTAFSGRLRGSAASIRGFKDEFVVPTSSWNVITGTLGGAGIFYNTTDGIISVTSDGSTGYTIMDKNLGATTVYNNNDTLSQANCGYYYQWGNNYGFAWTGSVTTSSTQVTTTGYGPGNYYSSSTFISGNDDWSNPANDNLRGGVTQGTRTQLKEYQVYSADKGWKPNEHTKLYLPLNGDVKDPYNNVTYSWGAGSASYATWSGSTQAANFTGSNAISIGTSLDYTGGTGGYTVCFWFTTTSPSYEQRCSTNVSGKYFNMCRISSSKANIYCRNSNGEQAIGGTTTLTANTKYLFTATFKSGSEMKLYLNGNLENSLSIGTFAPLSYQFGQWIGAGRTGDSEFWRGMIREFIVESRIWTADEVLDYYNQTK